MINLKYSKDVIDDYKKLSDGRKSYIKKRVKKLDVTVSDYLMSKYMGVNNNNNDEEKNRHVEKLINENFDTDGW